MSLIKANAVQIGQSGTATQNFTLSVPSSPDGTIKLARGNANATTQDVMNVSNAGVVSFPQGLGNISNSTAIATGSTTARSLANRFADVVNVKDYGAVGDGVTDNTPFYTAMIASVPAGSTIYWPKGTYVGDFVSNKSLILRGNGSTLIGAVNNSVIEFQGTLGSYQNLSSAPSYGDISLQGVSGLVGDTMVQLYSGNTRPPPNNAPVNYEVIDIKLNGDVYDKVYSDQNGGTPKYAIITPIDGVEIYDFDFSVGNNSTSGIFVRYAKNVRISNIGMVGGSATTVDVRSTINATIDHVRRIKPSATGSGEGYNVALNTTKYVKVDRVYGEETRHDFDQDSSYVTDVSGVISINCKSSSIVIAHNGFGGFISVRDCTITTNDYAINTSAQGSSSPNVLKFRHAVINNINISNNIDMTTSGDSYVGIYFQYPTENISISDITIKNCNNANSFNYATSAYNNAYFLIRAYQPDDVLDIQNIVADSATAMVWVDNISSQTILTSGITAKNLKVDYFRDVVVINNVPANEVGDVSIEDVKFYESTTIYGRAIVTVLATSFSLKKLMVRGLYNIPTKAKTIYLQFSADCPYFSYIDTAGFTRRLSSLNGVVAGGTITQNDYLSRGDFAVWGSTSKTLSITEPIERPVTTGNIFAIFNYSPTESLTIPANSTTVNNTSPIVIAPGEMHYFMADGNKWFRYRIQTGNSL